MFENLFGMIMVILLSLYIRMRQVILQFPSIVELIDFEFLINPKNITINKKYFTITGKFQEADIELAIAAFYAVVIEETQ